MDTLAGEVKRLVGTGMLSDIGANAAAARPMMTGAEQTGKAVIELASGFTRRRPNLSAMVGLRVHRAKEALQDVLSEEQTNSLRKMLGRPPREKSVQPKVTLVEGHGQASEEDVVPLTFAEEVERVDLGGSKAGGTSAGRLQPGVPQCPHGHHPQVLQPRRVIRVPGLERRKSPSPPVSTVDRGSSDRCPVGCSPR